jgi:hypothetical protein
MPIFTQPEDVIRAVLGAFTQNPALADPTTVEALETQAEAAQSAL